MGAIRQPRRRGARGSASRSRPDTHVVGISFVRQIVGARGRSAAAADRLGLRHRRDVRQQSRSGEPDHPGALQGSDGLARRPAAGRFSRAVPRPRRSANEERACARTILSTLARRAFRRPVSDGDVQHPAEVLRRRPDASGGFEAGIESALERILVSPDFLFRIELDPERASPARDLSSHRPRARLAAVVLPVEQHSGRRAARCRSARAAERSGGARAPGAAHARGPRAAGSLVDNFAAQWLQLRDLRSVVARSGSVPGIRREPARGLQAGDRAVRSTARSATTAASASC